MPAPLNLPRLHPRCAGCDSDLATAPRLRAGRGQVWALHRRRADQGVLTGWRWWTPAGGGAGACAPTWSPTKCCPSSCGCEVAAWAQMPSMFRPAGFSKHVLPPAGLYQRAELGCGQQPPSAACRAHAPRSAGGCQQTRQPGFLVGAAGRQAGCPDSLPGTWRLHGLETPVHCLAAPLPGKASRGSRPQGCRASDMGTMRRRSSASTGRPGAPLTTTRPRSWTWGRARATCARPWHPSLPTSLSVRPLEQLWVAPGPASGFTEVQMGQVFLQVHRLHPLRCLWLAHSNNPATARNTASAPSSAACNGSGPDAAARVQRASTNGSCTGTTTRSCSSTTSCTRSTQATWTGGGPTWCRTASGGPRAAQARLQGLELRRNPTYPARWLSQSPLGWWGPASHLRPTLACSSSQAFQQQPTRAEPGGHSCLHFCWPHAGPQTCPQLAGAAAERPWLGPTASAHLCSSGQAQRAS